MAVFDATTLLLFLEPDAKSAARPRRPNRPITDAKASGSIYLIDTLEKRRETIVIPTPALERSARPCRRGRGSISEHPEYHESLSHRTIRPTCRSRNSLQ